MIDGVWHKPCMIIKNVEWFLPLHCMLDTLGWVPLLCCGGGSYIECDLCVIELKCWIGKAVSQL